MGIKWPIGDGKSVDISKDWWCGTGTLELDYPGPNTNNNMRVKELIDDNGNWNLTQLANIVDEQMIEVKEIYISPGIQLLQTTLIWWDPLVKISPHRQCMI